MCLLLRIRAMHEANTALLDILVDPFGMTMTKICDDVFLPHVAQIYCTIKSRSLSLLSQRKFESFAFKGRKPFSCIQSLKLQMDLAFFKQRTITSYMVCLGRMF